MKNYLNYKELKKIGFKKIGKGCLISKTACFYNPKKISIGNNVRIDDFAILSSSKKNIVIKDDVNIGRSCHLNGSGSIILHDKVILSTFVTLHSSTHNYKGAMRKKKLGKIVIHKNCIIGSNSVIIGPCQMKENSALGALSLLKKNTEKNSLYYGVPAIKN
jgi:acetyltransferase-like isoleucine patch superfamily enzyme